MNQNPINIYLESNPNPNSLKFVSNIMLMPPGESYDFPDAVSARHAPLAQELFQFPFVSRVFYMSNFITITKIDAIQWTEVQDELKTFIKHYIESGKPLLADGYKGKESAEKAVEHADHKDSEMDVRIKGLLEEYIRPAVEQDGGAIQFQSYNDGVVKVLLQGSCSGCPSAMVTLKAGIENLLRTMIPEITAVEAEEM
jgi:Fe-S cluster biogenesis protein NfuA